jgi:hypothetical protein
MEEFMSEIVVPPPRRFRLFHQDRGTMSASHACCRLAFAEILVEDLHSEPALEDLDERRRWAAAQIQSAREFRGQAARVRKAHPLRVDLLIREWNRRRHFTEAFELGVFPHALTEHRFDFRVFSAQATAPPEDAHRRFFLSNAEQSRNARVQGTRESDQFPGSDFPLPALDIRDSLEIGESSQLGKPLLGEPNSFPRGADRFCHRLFRRHVVGHAIPQSVTRT